MQVGAGLCSEKWGSGGKPGRRVSPRPCELWDAPGSRCRSGLPFLQPWFPALSLCLWAAPLSGGCTICECASTSSFVSPSLPLFPLPRSVFTVHLGLDYPLIKCHLAVGCLFTEFYGHIQRGTGAKPDFGEVGNENRAAAAHLDWILIKFPASLNYRITGGPAMAEHNWSAPHCCLLSLGQAGKCRVGAGGGAWRRGAAGGEVLISSRGPSLTTGVGLLGSMLKVKGLQGEAGCCSFSSC